MIEERNYISLYLFNREECMRITWIEHKGKKILFEDYSNLRRDELLDVYSNV